MLYESNAFTFPRKMQLPNNEICTDDSYIFYNFEAIIPHSLRNFQHTSANVEFPSLNFGAHHERHNETLNILRQRTRTVRPNWNMQDVPFLHDNARPHTSLRKREAIAKMWWTLHHHPADSPVLAPSDCHLFGPVKDALSLRHFADDNELKRSFRAPKSRQGILQHWYTASYSTLAKVCSKWQTLRKNSPTIEQNMWINHVNFIAIGVITFVLSPRTLHETSEPNRKQGPCKIEATRLTVQSEKLPQQQGELTATETSEMQAGLLYCDSWTLYWGNKLQVFETAVFRKISGLKNDEVGLSKQFKIGFYK
jgi:hypothetical protein